MIWRAQCLLWLEARNQIFFLPKNCASSFSLMQFSFKILHILVFSLYAIRRPDFMKGLPTNTSMKFNLIVQVKRVLRKTVGGEWRFKILSESHLQNQVMVTWLPLRMMKYQSLPTVFPRTPFTWTIKVNNYWVQTIFYFADSCTVRWTYGWIIDWKMYKMMAYWELGLISYLGSMGLNNQMECLSIYEWMNCEHCYFFLLFLCLPFLSFWFHISHRGGKLYLQNTKDRKSFNSTF